MGNESTEDYEKRLKSAKDKFDINLLEFKRKKLSEAPCFRSTFLTSIPTGLFVGLFSYLVTSKAKISSHLGMGSFILVTAGYFANCRMEFDRKVKENKELSDLMNLIIKYKGTELEEQFQKKYSEKVMEMDAKSKYV